MPQSWEDVANMGIARIGTSSRVVSLEGSDKTSVACNTNIWSCRDAVLEGWDWKCASARAELTKDPTPPAYGFSFRYLLPTDCLMVREMHPSQYDYAIEGRYLLTDADSDEVEVFIRYTSSVDDPSQLTALCRKAIAWRMAAEICNQFVQGNTNTGQAAIMREYMVIVEEAQGVNQWSDKNHDEDSPKGGIENLADGRYEDLSQDSWIAGGTRTATR